MSARLPGCCGDIVSDAVDRGITVTEMAPAGQSLYASRETTAAFIGRALRGPLNEPVLINNFGDFRRRFGDVWSRSSLGPAVQQFFEHGGRNVYVVRVANGARGAMLCLPANGSALVLRALEPGSTERIRAAVDYDGIAADNDELFNLTLQRVDPETGLVRDQEIYRQAGFRQDKENFIVDSLLTSRLARAELPLPTHRPEATAGPNTPPGSAYAEHVQGGSDGTHLSAYDLVGSRRDETGLFALQQIEQFDLLYLPPPGKGSDVGPMAVLAAERYCRERGAMLIVDPSAGWTTAADAVNGLRTLGYASANMLGYFPRMRYRGEDTSSRLAVGGAIAGLLCRLDRNRGAWHALDDQAMGLNRRSVPAVALDDDAAQILVRVGLNVISKGAAGSARFEGNVTMSRGSESQREFASLPARRLCLQIVNAIRQATRWAVFEHVDAQLAAQIQSQVRAYLSQLADLGAFVNDRFFVHCEAGLSGRADIAEHGVTILISMHPIACREPVSFTLHHTVAGCRVASTAFAPVEMH